MSHPTVLFTLSLYLCACLLVQHAVVPLRGHPQVSAAGGAAGPGTVGVHHRRGGRQADHTHVAQEVPETHTGGQSITTLRRN